MVTHSSQHIAIASSPSQSRVLTTESWWWGRWDGQLFIWTMHVDDEDPGSIRVLLINSIWQSKYCWQFCSDQVMFSCFEPNQSAIITCPPVTSLTLMMTASCCGARGHSSVRSRRPRTPGVTRYTKVTSGVPARVLKVKSDILGVKVTGWHPPSLSSPGLYLWHAPASLLLPAGTCYQEMGDTSDQWQGDRSKVHRGREARCTAPDLLRSLSLLRVTQEYLTGCPRHSEL